jgi:pimeloyl-ACP methyl ester carboxylesterase
VLFSQLLAPGGAAKFEFIRLVVGIPRGPEWPISDWFFTTEGRAELERRAGGPVVQNLDHTYELTAADLAYLAGIGLADSNVIDGWLDHMRANRFSAPNKSRHYVEKYADYTGQLTRPVLTLHTAVDALVPPAHISKYHETVAAAGSADLLAEAWTSGVGHCNFTAQQIVTAVNAMDDWIATGDAPGPFPPSQGFIDVDPPPWPQP